MASSLTNQQSEAIAHLQEWRVGALFMEPGTGKTRVAVELVRQCHDVDFVLWIGPLRTIRTEGNNPSVTDEVAKWGDFGVPALYVGIESISASERIYLDVLEEVSRYKNVFCVVDESLKIKNEAAKRTKRVIEIGKCCQYRIILNGTPLSRNITDMWAQMEFLSPKILNMSHSQFINTFCRTRTVTHRIGRTKVWEKTIITGFENLDYLHSLIRHYVYQCDLSLNIEQYYRTRWYSLNEGELEEYRLIKEKYLDIDMLEQRNDNIFMEMTSEMQHSYCCTEDKIRCVREILEENDESSTIIFCRFVASRELCEKEFPKAKVLSYQKESLGLNLQDYHTTIYFDKVWDYALRMQSSRRTFRTGQEYDCTYYDITGNVGLENLIDKNIDKKISMSEYFKKVTMEELKKEL